MSGWTAFFILLAVVIVGGLYGAYRWFSFWLNFCNIHFINFPSWAILIVSIISSWVCSLVLTLIKFRV